MVMSLNPLPLGGWKLLRIGFGVELMEPQMRLHRRFIISLKHVFITKEIFRFSMKMHFSVDARDLIGKLTYRI
jgi:hypothetical protein